MSSSKKFNYKGTLRQVFICLRPRTRYPPPPYKLYTCIQVYGTYPHREGGGIEPERRLEGQQFTKLGQKYLHDWLYLQSINSDKHLPQSPFTDQFCRWRDFALMSILLISPWWTPNAECSFWDLLLITSTIHVHCAMCICRLILGSF